MLPKYQPPAHPGEILLEEFLRPLEMTQSDAARQMKLSVNRLNEIVRGKRGITAETALKLAKLLKTDAEWWMALQAQYDLWHAQQALRRSA